MKQEEEKAIGSTGKRVPRTEAGRGLQSPDESRQEISRSKPCGRYCGASPWRYCFGSGSLSGAGKWDRYSKPPSPSPLSLSACPVQPSVKTLWRKRHHPVHRSQLRSNCGRRNLYPARTVYPTGKLSAGNHRNICTSIHQFAAGRRTGYPFPYPIP